MTSSKYSKNLYSKSKTSKYKFDDSYNKISAQELSKNGDKIASRAKKMGSSLPNLQRAAKMTEKLSDGISNVSALLTTVDSVFQWLFHFSPLDEWVKKPFMGDWDALETTAKRWETLAEDLSQSVDDFTAIVESVGDGTSWSGEGANRFSKRNTEIITVLNAGIAPSLNAAEGIESLASFSEDAFDYIIDLIETIVDIISTLLTDLSNPVGWIKGGFDFCRLRNSVSDLVERGNDQIKELEDASESLNDCLDQWADASAQSSALPSAASGSAGGASSSTQGMRASSHDPLPGASVHFASTGGRPGSGSGSFGGR